MTNRPEPCDRCGVREAVTWDWLYHVCRRCERPEEDDGPEWDEGRYEEVEA